MIWKLVLANFQQCNCQSLHKFKMLILHSQFKNSEITALFLQDDMLFLRVKKENQKKLLTNFLIFYAKNIETKTHNNRNSPRKSCHLLKEISKTHVLLIIFSAIIEEQVKLVRKQHQQNFQKTVCNRLSQYLRKRLRQITTLMQHGCGEWHMIK